MIAAQESGDLATERAVILFGDFSRDAGPHAALHLVVDTRPRERELLRVILAGPVREDLFDGAERQTRRAHVGIRSEVF